jgi:cell wall-associated NlpC family hydrolase
VIALHAPDLRPYLGLPYRPGGDTRDGVDCYGLLRLVYRELCGLHLDEAEGVVGGEWRRVETARLWDALLFNIAGQPAHCGIALDNSEMLHIVRGGTSCIERFTSMRWISRIDGIYRHCRVQQATP